MKFTLPRIGAAALVAIALAACSSQSTIPSAAPQAIAPDAVSAGMSLTGASFDALTPNATSPCDVKGFWYFKGACIAAKVPSAGGKITVPAYKGLTLGLSVGKSNSKNTVFLFGDGTSSADITGTFKGKKFPSVGSLPCVSPSTGKSIPCVGKGFVYVEVGNTSSKVTVSFTALPAVTVATTGAFPGTKECAENIMAFSTSTGAPAAYYVLGVSKPKGKTLAFPGAQIAFSFKPLNTIVYGFSCK